MTSKNPLPARRVSCIDLQMFADTCFSKKLEWVGPLRLSPGEVARIPVGIAGVYALHLLSISLGTYPIFYVGQSKDLHRRLREHLRWRRTKAVISAFRATEECYFSAAPVSVTDLAAVEAGLIRLLRPPGNDLAPLCFPYVSNLPPVRLT